MFVFLQCCRVSEALVSSRVICFLTERQGGLRQSFRDLEPAEYAWSIEACGSDAAAISLASRQRAQAEHLRVVAR